MKICGHGNRLKVKRQSLSHFGKSMIVLKPIVIKRDYKRFVFSF